MPKNEAPMKNHPRIPHCFAILPFIMRSMSKNVMSLLTAGKHSYREQRKQLKVQGKTAAVGQSKDPSVLVHSDSSHTSQDTTGTWNHRSPPGHFCSWHWLEHIFSKPERGLYSHEQGFGFFFPFKILPVALWTCIHFFTLPAPRTCARSHKSQLPVAGGTALLSWICLLLVSQISPIFRLLERQQTLLLTLPPIVLYVLAHPSWVLFGFTF